MRDRKGESFRAIADVVPRQIQDMPSCAHTSDSVATVELCSTQIHEKLRVTVPGYILAPGVKVGDLCANFYFIWRRNMEHAQGDGNEKDT